MLRIFPQLRVLGLLLQIFVPGLLVG
jgi:hypothetical protein